ncbi:unnamed protein product [Knipowitschia caucasica]|uniref:LINE-1 type transposase domain-containing 1 n=1 Tax=Knipowitschia caucasica TaxID=637954 RepID=A0AAV2LIQ3_KNICA
MQPKSAKSNEKTAEIEVSSSHATVSKADIIALLAEHRSALLAELKNSFFDNVNNKLDGLQKVSDSHGERLESLEENADTISERLAKVENVCESLHAANEKLSYLISSQETDVVMPVLSVYRRELRAHSLQNCSRRCCKMFLARTFSLPLQSWIVHTVLWPLNRPREAGLGLSVCFHRYQNKELLIREARGRNDLKYMDKPFRIYEDYSPEVVSQRREYRSVMADLYRLGLRPSLQYPVQLRITEADGVRRTFGSVVEAERFVEHLKKD